MKNVLSYLIEDTNSCMGKYKKFITNGIAEPLDTVPFHQKAPIRRLSMLDKSIIPESNTHVAVHFVDASKKLPQYSEPHKHNQNEINLILSENSKLKYKILLGNETYMVTSPSTIFIPKGLQHSAQAVSGKGIFVCIILSAKYTSKGEST